MPNGDENELIIGDTSMCLVFLKQIYTLQIGGAAKGLGIYGNFPGALAAAQEVLLVSPELFAQIKGQTDGRVYFQHPGELRP